MGGSQCVTAGACEGGGGSGGVRDGAGTRAGEVACTYISKKVGAWRTPMKSPG